MAGALVGRRSAHAGASRDLRRRDGRPHDVEGDRPPDPAGVDQVGPVLIAPDGKSYVYSYRRVLDDLYLATGLR